MVSVHLPSDALLQHLLSYLGFSYLGWGISLHGCSSKVQLLLLTLGEGYLLTAAPSDLQRGTVRSGGSAPPQAAPRSQEGGAAQASWLLPRPLSRPRKAFWGRLEAAQAPCWLIPGRRLGSPLPRPWRVGLSPDLTRLGLCPQADEGSDSGAGGYSQGQLPGGGGL